MNLIPWRGKSSEEGQAAGAPLVAFRNEMDRLFDTFVREPFGGLDWPFGGQAKWLPAVDVAENESEVTVRAEVPGIDPKDLEVTVSGNQLVLSGEKKETTEKNGKDFCRSEIRFGSFRRSVPLPDGVDSEHVDAQYANGLLTLRLKKLQTAAPKRIEIGRNRSCSRCDCV